MGAQSKTSLHFLRQLAICTQHLKPSHHRQFPYTSALYRVRLMSVVCWLKFTILGSTPELELKSTGIEERVKRAELFKKTYCKFVCRKELCIWMCPALYISLFEKESFLKKGFEVEFWKHLTYYSSPYHILILSLFLVALPVIQNWIRNSEMFYFTSSQ